MSVLTRCRNCAARAPSTTLYSTRVFTGSEGDVFHRIVGQHDKFHWVGFASEPIRMGLDLNVEQFFSYDPFWIAEDKALAQRQAIARQQEYLRQQQLNNAFLQLGRRRSRRNWRFYSSKSEKEAKAFVAERIDNVARKS